MALLSRLTGIDLPLDETSQRSRIHVHEFGGLIREILRGKLTPAQARDALNATPNAIPLTPAEESEALALFNRAVIPLEALPIGGRITLTNIGSTFITLGFASIQTAGIRRFELAVGLSRNGSAGNLEFQLADVTSGASQQLLLTDAAGSPAGERFITGNRDYDPALSAGIARIALRARSTTATDDPIHLGSSLLVHRQDVLTPDEIHDVLCLAQSRIPPYDTIAFLQTRLGVS